MPSNADYTREYFQIIDELDGDIESRRAAFNYMQDSTAIVHHLVVASSFVPRLFNRKTYEVMKRTAETSHRILSARSSSATGPTRSTASCSISTSVSWSSYCCPATTTRCCPSPAWTRS